MYSTGCKRYPLSRIQPLSHRWFLIKGIKALVCPFAVLRSRFGLRYSRVRGRRQSKFLASSSTGGARNFYPCTGEPRALPRRTQICRRRHCAAVTPAAGGRPSSVTVRAAPHRATFPKGKAMCSAQSTGEPRTLIAPRSSPCSKQKPHAHGGAQSKSPVLKPVLKAKAPCSSPCSKQKPRAHLSTELFFV